MISEFLSDMGPQHWMIFGFVLLVLEMATPAMFFMWFGVAALVVAALLVVMPLPPALQWVIFACLAVSTAFLYRALKRKKNLEQSDQPLLNHRMAALIGQRFVLAEPISNGRGRLRIGDAFWRISGADLASGTTIVVKSINGLDLEVEAVP